MTNVAQNAPKNTLAGKQLARVIAIRKAVKLKAEREAAEKAAKAKLIRRGYAIRNAMRARKEAALAA